MPSLTHSTNHRPNAIHEPLVVLGITRNINGDSSSRPTVIALAQFARRPGSTGISAARRAAASGRDEIGPEGIDDLDVDELPTARSSADVHDAVDLGRLAWVRATPGASTSTSTRRRSARRAGGR